MKKRTLAVAAIILLAVPVAAQETEPAGEEKAEAGVRQVEQILKQAEEAIAKVNDYSGLMIKHERFGKKVEKAIMEFKFARPFKVYVKYREPHRGREAIYIPGWNNGEVKVHKGSFPDLTMNLDPYGSWAMEGNHHPITHFGLESTIKISANNLRKAIKNNEGDFKVSESVMWGRPVWKIEAWFPKGGHTVVAEEKETLWDISKRTGQDMFLIMYANKDYDAPDDVKKGQRVFIPRYYGGRAEFCVDRETRLPIKASTRDWNGNLYESYEYPELKLNVGLTQKDFDPKNSDYNF